MEHRHTPPFGPAAALDPRRTARPAGSAAHRRRPRWTTAALAVGISLAAALPVADQDEHSASGPVTVLVNAVTPGPPAAQATGQNASAYATIQCEDYDEQNGIRLEGHSGGLHAGFISTGDWLRFDNVDFTDVAARRMLFRASNAARQNRTGRVEVRLDSLSRPPIASMTIPNNGDWLEFLTYELSIPSTVGVHAVYLTFTSAQNEEFANVDWLTFRR